MGYSSGFTFFGRVAGWELHLQFHSVVHVNIRWVLHVQCPAVIQLGLVIESLKRRHRSLQIFSATIQHCSKLIFHGGVIQS